MRMVGCLFRREKGRRAAGVAGGWSLLLLFFFFVAGSVVGAVLGSEALAEATGDTVLSGDGDIYAASGYFPLLLSCAKYHIAVLALASSLLGVLLIPCAMALRGFVLSCAVSAVASSYTGLRGALLIALVFGLPSLITLPCLFLLARDGFCFSMRLLAVFDRRQPPPLGFDLITDVSLTAIAVCVASALEYFAIPLLARLII